MHHSQKLESKGIKRDTYRFVQVRLSGEVFREAANNSGIGGTESHFHAVDSCQICHLSNYTINQSPGCYHDSSNQERGSDSDPT